VHISIHQGGLARLLARKSWKLFGADNDQATALAFPRPEVRMLRLDPARGIVNDVWWQSARNADAADLAAEAQGATIDQMSGATIEATPDSRGHDLQLVEPPCKTLQTFGSHRTPPQHDVTSAFAAGGDKERDRVLLPMPVPAPTPDEAGWRLQRWPFLLLRMFRHFHLFRVRRGEANVITGPLFRQKALPSTGWEPAEPNEELTGDVRPAEISVQVTDDATEGHFLEPPRCSEAMLSEAVSVIESAKETVAAGSCETPSVVGVTGDMKANAKKLLGLGLAEPVFLYAGEMSYAAGVDILTDALTTVCQGHQGAQFVFIGVGPLRNDMEAQVSTAGFAHRCRFTGDLPPATFELMLAACDVVVIPAREPQDSELAERAHTLGKPVLTTHQAQVRGIVHGHNGLLAYDCANSLVWGLRELIAKPLHLHPQQESVEQA
jgi:glycosyltransferase involved in cell wall biosynthesis